MIHHSILILGATGRTGLQIIQHIHQHQQQQNPPSSDNSNSNSDTVTPKIFAFCRDPSKIQHDSPIKTKCHAIIQGNARSSSDIDHALQHSQADLVVVCVGNGDSVKKSDTRAASAQALVKVLSSTPSYGHVRVLVVSSIGAGASRIKAGCGIGMFLEYHLRHILADHTKQEAIFVSSLQDRTMIVRPTGLTEDDVVLDAKNGGKMVTFGDQEKCPTVQTSRSALAAWLVKEAICSRVPSVYFGNKPVNVTYVG